MGSQFKDLLADVQSLLDDPEGDWYNQAIVLPHANRALRRITSELLSNPNIGRIKSVVEIPSVAPGTTSLKSQFASGGPLALLKLLYWMEERDATSGTSLESNWLPMDPTIALPSIASAQAYNRVYAFPGDDIKLPGSTLTTSLRLMGVFEQPALAEEESPIVPGIFQALSFLTASYAAKARGNTSQGKDLRDEYDGELDDFFNLLIMEQQRNTSRNRPFVGRSFFK